MAIAPHTHPPRQSKAAWELLLKPQVRISNPRPKYSVCFSLQLSAPGRSLYLSSIRLRFLARRAGTTLYDSPPVSRAADVGASTYLRPRPLGTWSSASSISLCVAPELQVQSLSVSKLSFDATGACSREHVPGCQLGPTLARRRCLTQPTALFAKPSATHSSQALGTSSGFSFGILRFYRTYKQVLARRTWKGHPDKASTTTRLRACLNPTQTSFPATKLSASLHPFSTFPLLLVLST